MEDPQPPFDIALSDRFTYDEDVYAAYASLNKDWDPWALKLGLRAEHTEVKAASETLDEINRQSYTELFPSVYFSRALGEDHSLALTYNRRLTRPNYQDLNPFRFFLNENDYDEGNPNLVPNFSHNFNLNWTVKNTFFVDMYYRDNGRYISTLSFQDNENQTLRQINQNVESSYSYGLDVTIATSITPFWYVYSYNSVFYEDETFLAEESDIETYTNKVTGFYGYLNNSMTLSRDGSLTAEVSILYLSGFLNGTYKMSETTTLNLGLRKTLWEGRAILSLVAEDLLGAAVRLSDRCCGEAGTLAVSRPDIATQIRFLKQRELQQGLRELTDSDTAAGHDVKLLTSCPACQQGLSRYRDDTGLTAEYIVVELANHLLGAHWQSQFVERVKAGGIERVLL